MRGVGGMVGGMLLGWGGGCLKPQPMALVPPPPSIKRGN